MGGRLPGDPGGLTIGQLIAFRIISGYVVGPLLNLATSWQTFQGVALSIERLSDVVDAPTESAPKRWISCPCPPLPVRSPSRMSTSASTSHLRLVVRKVNFQVEAGAFIGIGPQRQR